MSIRTLFVAVPAAFLALGIMAMSTSSSFATDNVHDDYALHSGHAAAVAVHGLEIAHKKRKHVNFNSRRFSGFGFRGDGFRTSGKYN